MNITKIILLTFLQLITLQLWSQTEKNSVRLSGIAAHYINNEQYDLTNSYPGYYTYPVDLGIEFLYLRKLNQATSLATGINFQNGRVASYMNGLRRFHFNELSIPLIIQRNFILNETNCWFISGGVYGGRMTLQKAENPNSAGSWHEWAYLEEIENYSDDTLFADIYIDFGYSKSLTKLGEFSLSPFFKYRINNTWLNYHQKKPHFGVKINYSFNF